MELFTALIVFLLFLMLLGMPAFLTIFHLVVVFRTNYQGRLRKWRVVCEILTMLLGPVYSLGYLVLADVQMKMDWTKELINHQVHTPVATFAWPTLLTLACMGLVGYLLLRLIPLNYMPPLVVVTGIAFVYAGLLVCILWCIQIMGIGFMLLTVFPLNLILLALIQIKSLMLQWNQLQEEERRGFRNPFLQRLNQRLLKAAVWPAAALVLLLPLLGIAVGILVLFGQQPDNLIRAFTETSEWNLSQKTSPQNVYCDEHYLCTAAAGGHRRVVKPLRLGIRHDHAVIVNRQLCVANAFEQILEEKMPRLHQKIRHFYDTYGFPIARKIRSPYTADLVYLLMKPLEWIFLIVIYFCDVKPENRIALQYTGREGLNLWRERRGMVANSRIVKGKSI